jgi:hypothetical protein
LGVGRDDDGAIMPNSPRRTIRIRGNDCDRCLEIGDVIIVPVLVYFRVSFIPAEDLLRIVSSTTDANRCAISTLAAGSASPDVACAPPDRGRARPIATRTTR